MPMVWQKSSQLVQQPSPTCWQLSISSSVCESSNDPALPPSCGRDSMSVILNPLGASATAAARPARPPPMINKDDGGEVRGEGRGASEEGELPFTLRAE